MGRTSYTCPKCPFEGFPEFTMTNAGKMVVQCPRCQREDPSLGPPDFSTGVAVDASPEAAPGFDARPARVVIMGADRLEAPQKGLPSPPPATAPGDVLAWMESRLQWLMAEEARYIGQIAEAKARLTGVKTEAARLRKMLSAGRRIAPLAAE